MPEARNNVLRRGAAPVTNSYRKAVSQIIRQVQGDLTDHELAERIGVSEGTVANARNQKCDLGGVTLARIAYEFGPEALDPFMRLGNGRAVPLTSDPANDLSMAAKLSHASGTIIDAVSDGHRCHTETLEIADKFRPLVPQMTAIIDEADQLRGAA